MNVKSERRISLYSLCLSFIDKESEVHRGKDVPKITHPIRSRDATGLFLGQTNQPALTAS